MGPIIRRIIIVDRHAASMRSVVPIVQLVELVEIGSGKNHRLGGGEVALPRTADAVLDTDSFSVSKNAQQAGFEKHVGACAPDLVSFLGDLSC